MLPANTASREAKLHNWKANFGVMEKCASADFCEVSRGVLSFVREWRPSVDETDNYVSAGAL